MINKEQQQKDSPKKRPGFLRRGINAIKAKLPFAWCQDDNEGTTSDSHTPYDCGINDIAPPNTTETMLDEVLRNIVAEEKELNELVVKGLTGTNGRNPGKIKQSIKNVAEQAAAQAQQIQIQKQIAERARIAAETEAALEQQRANRRRFIKSTFFAAILANIARKIILTDKTNSLKLNNMFDSLKKETIVVRELTITNPAINNKPTEKLIANARELLQQNQSFAHVASEIEVAATAKMQAALDAVKQGAESVRVKNTLDALSKIAEHLHPAIAQQKIAEFIDSKQVALTTSKALEEAATAKFNAKLNSYKAGMQAMRIKTVMDNLSTASAQIIAGFQEREYSGVLKMLAKKHENNQLLLNNLGKAGSGLHAGYKAYIAREEAGFAALMYARGKILEQQAINAGVENLQNLGSFAAQAYSAYASNQVKRNAMLAAGATAMLGAGYLLYSYLNKPAVVEQTQVVKPVGVVVNTTKVMTDEQKILSSETWKKLTA